MVDVLSQACSCGGQGTCKLMISTAWSMIGLAKLRYKADRKDTNTMMPHAAKELVTKPWPVCQDYAGEYLLHHYLTTSLSHVFRSIQAAPAITPSN